MTPNIKLNKDRVDNARERLKKAVSLLDCDIIFLSNIRDSITELQGALAKLRAAEGSLNGVGEPKKGD